MRKRVINIIFFLLLFFWATLTDAQSYFSTKGNDFWCGFMLNSMSDTTQLDTLYPATKGTSKMAIYITADNSAASGTVSVPKAGWSVNYTVAPNSTTQIKIPIALVMASESETIENKGIHITSDVPVSVYQLNYSPFTSDANIVIPTQSLGTKYSAMCYAGKDFGSNASQFLVVAAYDNTVIKITPKCATVGPGGVPGHPPNIPFNITLNSGEVYQLQGNYLAPTDLTGSVIELDTLVSDNCKKFAVFSGNIAAFVPSSICCANHLCEQMMPVKTWGTKYITVPLKTRVTDIFRIMASQSGTIITFDGGAPIPVTAGSYYEYKTGTASYIESNKPISVAQFSESAQTDGNPNSDPFMIMLQPLDQSIGKIVFNSFASNVITNYYLNIVTRTAYKGLLKLDGSPIAAAAFTAVPSNAAYSFARLDLTQGNHSLQSDSGYTANIYGYGNFESYGYIAGATIIDPEIGYTIKTPTATIKYFLFTDTICKGTALTFNAFTNKFITDNFWNFGDGSAVIHGKSVTHTYDKAGKFILTYYYQRAGICGLDSIVWDMHIKCCNPKPGITLTSPVCIGLNSSITDTSAFNPNATYKWDFNGGNIVSGSLQGPYEVNWSAQGQYTVKVIVSEPSCSSDSAIAVVNVNPVPTSTFTLNSPICAKENTNIIYTGNASPSANYQWNFDSGKIISGSAAGPYVASWSNSGTFNVTLIVSEGGCSSPQTSVPITIFALPVPSFIADPITTTTDHTLITFTDNSTNTSIWKWNFGESLSGADNFSSIPSPTHTYAGEGVYTVWLVATSPDNCIDSSSVMINISDYNSFYVPNAFSLKSDVNYIFRPYGTDVIEYVIYIYNRWGAMIFKSEIENQPWDGKYNGQNVESGVYVWQIKYLSKKGVKKSALGRVTVLR